MTPLTNVIVSGGGTGGHIHPALAIADEIIRRNPEANVRFVGPAHLMPPDDQFTDIPRFDNLKEGLDGADVAMALRMQFERMEGDGKALAQGFFEEFGLTHETLKLAKPGARVMHPGPMNRGVEIDSATADDVEKSLIRTQVEIGVAARMACLEALAGREPEL